MRVLDLFCGAGGAAMGYHRAGFTDIVGIDLAPQPHYPFTFIQGDALAPPVRLDAFDAIHASPPCQSYSTMSNRWGSDVPAMIAPIAELLASTGLPWVIENVAGAKSVLDSSMSVRLTGEQFGLRVHRPRLFWTNWLLFAPAPAARQDDAVAVYGKNDGRRLWTRTDGTELRVANLADAREAMEMPWADWHGVKEAIPPAYTEFIGRQLLEVAS